MSEFKALSRSFSRNALKKMGLGGGSSTASPTVSRRASRRRSQDGALTHRNRPSPIVVADHALLDENFVKTVIPKKEGAQAIILEALQNSTLFRDMEHDQRVDVMLAMDKITVKAGQDLIRQGEPGNAFYVIEKGEFDIVIDGCRVTTYVAASRAAAAATPDAPPRLL